MPYEQTGVYSRRNEFRLWRGWDADIAERAIERAAAANRGEEQAAGVPVYADDASEANIERAVVCLNRASWAHHVE